MNTFEIEAARSGGEGLRNIRIETLQANLGLKCNQRCNHCHLEASPDRKEVVERLTMELVLKATRSVDLHLVDLTGERPNSILTIDVL